MHIESHRVVSHDLLRFGPLTSPELAVTFETLPCLLRLTEVPSGDPTGSSSGTIGLRSYRALERNYRTSWEVLMDFQEIREDLTGGHGLGHGVGGPTDRFCGMSWEVLVDFPGGLGGPLGLAPGRVVTYSV